MSNAPPESTIPRDYNFAADILKRNLDAGRGNKLAYIDHRGQYTYAALADRVERFGQVLRSLGSRREERVLICLLDTIDWPTAFLGAIKAGVVAVPVNTLMTEADYRFMLKDSRARVLVVSEALYEKFADAIRDSDDLEHVIVSGDDAHSHLSFDALMAEAKTDAKIPDGATAATTRDDMCFWLYTSGSTGRPKGAVHTHADLKLTDALYAAPVIGIRRKRRLLFGGEAVLRLRARQRAHFSVVVPAPPPCCCRSGRRRTRSPSSSRSTTSRSSMRCRRSMPPSWRARRRRQRSELKIRRCISAGEALPAEIGRRWSERYGVDILDGLGSTEMLHIFLSNRAGAVKYGTSGKPLPGYDLRLVDDDGTIVTKRGDMGELQVRGPTSAMMYWNNREQSRATFLGEWTRSGDKYVEDDDGYFVYCGRRDDMLKVSGMYVSPFEVEGVLQSHPDVLEAAVVGWPDTDALIKPKAFVVLKVPDKASDAFAQKLQDECRKKLAVYKYPRWIEFRTELPKTATGKIQRFKLRAEAERRSNSHPPNPAVRP